MDLRNFLSQPVEAVAEQLIGWELIFAGPNGSVGGIIAETEAYHSEDPASHTFNGPSERNRAMFMPPGTIYVYRSYGLHNCMNIVSGSTPGSGVLLRALEPRVGIDIMRQNRNREAVEILCRGPGNVTQALGINLSHNAVFLWEAGIELTPPLKAIQTVRSPRIGISKAQEQLWRFYIPNSLYVSGPKRNP